MRIAEKKVANKKLIAMSVFIAMLFVGSIAGAFFYYEAVKRGSMIASLNTKIDSLNAQIANQNGKISNLTSQVSNLNGQLENLTAANLATDLGVSEVGNTSMSMYPYPYYRLYVSGTVTNKGMGTAYAAGLYVVAYNATGTLEINMTVPLSDGATFGTDDATKSFVSYWTNGNLGSLQLQNLGSGQTATVDLDIFHEGTVTNWTLTPVCYSYSP